MRRLLDTDLRRTAWRIGIQTAVLLMLCLTAVGALTYATVVNSQNRQMSQTLTDAAALASAGGDPDRDHDNDNPTGGVHTAVLADGQLRLSARVPPGLPETRLMEAVALNGQDDQRTVVVAAGRYRVLTVRRDDQVVQAMASLFEQHQERERILGALGTAGGAGLVLATLLGAFLAHRAVQPMANALALQRRFVADAGHELRTPLTLLSTRAQLLHRRIHNQPKLGPAAERPGTDDLLADDDRLARDVQGIMADTRTLTDILEELLLAADTRTELPDEPVDLAVLTQAAVASAQATAHTAAVELTLQITGPVVVPAGNSTALKRCVTALLDNALGHAEARVWVDVQQQGKSVVVQVTDDGPGIPRPPSHACLPGSPATESSQSS